MAKAVFESAYVPRGAARAADERARSWARWTLDGPDRPLDAAACVVERILRRGALVPAPETLERGLAARLGPRLAAGLRAAHRLQVAAVRACCVSARTDLGGLGAFSPEEARAIEALAWRDLAALRADVGALYPGAAPEEGPFFFSFAGSEKPGWDCWSLEDGGGEPEALPAPEELPPAAASRDALRSLLRRLFGYEEFRSGQAECVEALLAGRDAAALLPTGAGKSLIFQLAALLRPGTAVVVEPLLSVIADQRRSLALAGITAVGEAADLAALSAGRLLLVYVSPERLDAAAFRRALGAAAERGVPFAVVDEAHCVSPWGHDFRPALLAAGKRLRSWAAGPAGEPALAALTGTASRAQLVDAAAALELREPVTAAAPLARPELSFEVERCGPGEHAARLRAWLVARARFGPGLVFCPAVDGPRGAAALCEELVWSDNVSAGCFTGRAPEGRDSRVWEERKRADAAAFLAGRLDWLVCTRAFGLGVDVPRARWTVHLGLADSLEGFFQETGRAGRDGRAAVCRVLLHLVDERRAMKRLDPRSRWDAVRDDASARDDVSRALALHARGFPGRAAEREDAALAAAAAGPMAAGALKRVAMPGQSRAALERWVSRLEAAGAVEVWDRASLTVLPLRDLDVPRLRAAAWERIDDVYERIEPARRASLGRLLEALLDRDPDAALRKACAAWAPAAAGP